MNLISGGGGGFGAGIFFKPYSSTGIFFSLHEYFFKAQLLAGIFFRQLSPACRNFFFGGGGGGAKSQPSGYF